MSDAVLAALLGLLGSAFGSTIGILTNSKLTQYRLKKLEEKVDKHNSVVERTYKLEDRADIIEERLKFANHRIDSIEKKGA